MPIKFACPHCESLVIVADEHAGKTGRCQNCGKPVTVPALSDDASPATSEQSPDGENEGTMDGPSPTQERQYEVAHGKQRLKPLSKQQIIALLNAGELDLSDMVNDMAGLSWKPLREHEHFRSLAVRDERRNEPEAVRESRAGMYGETGRNPQSTEKWTDVESEERGVEAESDTISETVSCTNCGRTVSASHRGCPHCGGSDFTDVPEHQQRSRLGYFSFLTKPLPFSFTDLLVGTAGILVVFGVLWFLGTLTDILTTPSSSNREVLQKHAEWISSKCFGKASADQIAPLLEEITSKTCYSLGEATDLLAYHLDDAKGRRDIGQVSAYATMIYMTHGSSCRRCYTN